jgi:hypothetical protein
MEELEKLLKELQGHSTYLSDMAIRIQSDMCVFKKRYDESETKLNVLVAEKSKVETIIETINARIKELKKNEDTATHSA